MFICKIEYAFLPSSYLFILFFHVLFRAFIHSYKY